MPTLAEFIEVIHAFSKKQQADLGDDFFHNLASYLQREYPGERFFIPRPDTSKKAQILECARHLPPDVVVERFGVTRRYVNKITRRK